MHPRVRTVRYCKPSLLYRASPGAIDNESGARVLEYMILGDGALWHVPSVRGEPVAYRYTRDLYSWRAKFEFQHEHDGDAGEECPLCLRGECTQRVEQYMYDPVTYVIHGAHDDVLAWYDPMFKAPDPSEVFG